MMIAMFSSMSYDRTACERANREHGLEISFLAPRLPAETAPRPDAERVLTYVPLDELLARSHAISLHCPLTPETRDLIDAGAIARMTRRRHADQHLANVTARASGGAESQRVTTARVA